VPTTLTGVLLFVVLLLPGFAYAVGRERAAVERKLPALRETASIVAASITFELVVLLVLWPAWSRAIDFNALNRSPGKYWQQHPALLAVWGLGMLGLAALIAYTAAKPNLRRRLSKIMGEYPHPSATSAWWVVFRKWTPSGGTVTVGCYLEDGSYLAGHLKSFSNAADDTADRDLILTAPIFYRRCPNDLLHQLDAGAIVVSGRRILFMTAKHWKPGHSSEAEGSTTGGGGGAS
jgi:uncharacterized protein DUF6338